MTQQTYYLKSTVDDRVTHQAIVSALSQINDCSVSGYDNPLTVSYARKYLSQKWLGQATITINEGLVTFQVNCDSETKTNRFLIDLRRSLPPNLLYDPYASPTKADKNEKFLNRKEYKKIANELEAEEEILVLTSAIMPDGPGVVAVTRHRILAYVKAPLGGKTTTREILPSMITSISTGKSFGLEQVELTVSNSKVQLRALPAGMAKEIVGAIKSLKTKSAQENTSAPAPASKGKDFTEELEKLGQLHSQGILTDGEFQAAKARVLGL